MADEQIRVRIDDDEDTGHAVTTRARADNNKDAAGAADPPHLEEERRRFAERAHLRQQAAESQRIAIEAQATAVASEAQAAEIEYQTAFEYGDAAKMAAAQRKLARAEARALRIDEVKANIEADRHAGPAGDRFETYLSQFTAPTASWLRSHRDWVDDRQKNERLRAAHFDAMAEGLTPDTPSYFAHVESKIGLREDDGGGRSRGRRNGARTESDGVTVRQLKAGDQIPAGAVRMSRGEYEAATQNITWGYNDPNGRFKKDDPIGVREYLRRQGIMKATPGWYDKQD